jgi:hypothetical protein
MTEKVYWANEQARDLKEQPTEVTITDWDYERKCGTATLPTGQVTEVRMVTVLAIVEQKGQQ